MLPGAYTVIFTLLNVIELGPLRDVLFLLMQKQLRIALDLFCHISRVHFCSPVYTSTTVDCCTFAPTPPPISLSEGILSFPKSNVSHFMHRSDYS